MKQLTWIKNFFLVFPSKSSTSSFLSHLFLYCYDVRLHFPPTHDIPAKAEKSNNKLLKNKFLFPISFCVVVGFLGG